MNFILEIAVVLMLSAMMIYYYYNLYLSTKSAKLLLILEVGLRAISFTVYIVYGVFVSYWELIHFVPMFLSITLYLAKGITAKVLFGILSSMMIVLATRHIISMF